MKAKSVKREAKTYDQKLFSFCDNFWKRYLQQPLIFTNCTRKGENSCYKGCNIFCIFWTKVIFVQVSCFFVKRCKRDLETRYQSRRDEGKFTRPIYKKQAATMETKLESVATNTETSVARGGSEVTVDIETVEVRTVKKIFSYTFAIDHQKFH